MKGAADGGSEPNAQAQNFCCERKQRGILLCRRAKHQIGGGQMNELTDRRQRGAEIAASGADQAVEEHVKTDLANAFPDDGFGGKESEGWLRHRFRWRTPSTEPRISRRDFRPGVLHWPMSKTARCCWAFWSFRNGTLSIRQCGAAAAHATACLS